jgi:hypothetical protein
MAAARSARRLRSAESANSRNTALRDVPRRVASASTSLRRSSGIDTITFAMRAVYRGIRARRNYVSISRYRLPAQSATLGLRAEQFRPFFLPVREPGTRARRVPNAPGVRIAWHPRLVDESGHPRYRDNEDSRFYKTASLSPEDTWRALSDELGHVLMDAQRALWRGRLELDAERVRWWHGAIFARHLPHDGARFRRERAFFGVMTDGGGMRQIEGTAPDALVRDLAEVCAAFNSGTSQFDRRDTGIAEQTRVVAALYAGILRVHPLPTGTIAPRSWRFRRHCGRWGSPLSNSRMTKT